VPSAWHSASLYLSRVVAPPIPSPVLVTQATWPQLQTLRSAILTPAPGPGPFSHIYVTITDVQIHASASAGPNDPGWVDLTPNLRSNPQQVDLLAEANNQCFLASLGSTTELQPGSYQQIRLFLADNSVSVPSNQCGMSANCVMLSTSPGTPLPLDISSESKTGIKIPSGQIAGGQFTVAAGQTKDLNIDVDACASIVSEGKGKGRYRLKPVLHAGEVALTSVSINGKVIDRTTGQPISAGVTVVALEQRDTAGIDRVIMETVTDSSGSFVFCPVEQCTATVTATPQLPEVIETREHPESESPDLWRFFQPGFRRP
jgi:hypothetical protein